MHPHSVLVTVTGYDRPGVTSALFAALAAHDVEVLDVEQVVISDRLVLGVVLALHGDPAPLRRAVTHAAEALGTEVEVTITEDPDDVPTRVPPRHHVLVLGRPLRAGAVGEMARRIAELGGNIDSIVRLTPPAGHRAGAGRLRRRPAPARRRAGGRRRRRRRGRRGRAGRAAAPGQAAAAARPGRRRGRRRTRSPRSPTRWTAAPSRACCWPRPAAGRTAEVVRARAALLAGVPAGCLDALQGRMQWAHGVAGAARRRPPRRLPRRRGHRRRRPGRRAAGRRARCWTSSPPTGWRSPTAG